MSDNQRKNSPRFKYLISISCLLLAVLTVYGLGRLYFYTTAGFTLGNIHSDLSHHVQWDTREPTEEETLKFRESIAQDYYYLGKGCQSYVFLSQDGKYVIKFFKFQRVRPQNWIDFFTFIPSVKEYQNNKIKEKENKLNNLFLSCKLAFDDLKNETGVIYVHLNKTDHLHHSLRIYDKLGLSHQLDLDRLEFVIQHRASMLADTIDDLMSAGQIDQSKLLIDKLLIMVLSEYYSGYADNDHALMQNTGVLNGNPIHIDVGQLIYNNTVRDPAVYHQEIMNKMTQARNWLKERHPELLDHLNNRLLTELGADFYLLPPYIYKGNVAKIPHMVKDL